MNVQEYLSNYYKGTKKPTIDAMKYFMEEFNHPERELKVIHIAGTNGKGSCTEMMSNILIKAGYKVGKFISPHLIKYNERISVGNKYITDKEMEKLIIKIQPKIDKYNKKNNIDITLFELETTMALLYFYEKKCDYVVMETGLGGLHDSTNIVNPIISIITSVSYDHMHILGNTLKEIAKQKAGIIKENSNTVFIKQDEEEVNKEIEKTCKEKNNNAHMINIKDVKNYSFNEKYQKFDYKDLKDIEINLKGKKQINNAIICIESTKILRDNGVIITDEQLRNALKTVVHKARFETISNKPLIIYDGAHNELAIENFINSVEMYYSKRKKVYIISILKIKDYETMIKELVKDNDSVFIFTDGNSKKRYVEKEKLLECAKNYTSNKNLYIKELEDALKFVGEKYKDYVTFVVGSFYIYGIVLKFCKKDDKIE